MTKRKSENANAAEKPKRVRKSNFTSFGRFVGQLWDKHNPPSTVPRQAGHRDGNAIGPYARIVLSDCITSTAETLAAGAVVLMGSGKTIGLKHVKGQAEVLCPELFSELDKYADEAVAKVPVREKKVISHE